MHYGHRRAERIRVELWDSFDVCGIASCGIWVGGTLVVRSAECIIIEG